MSLAVIILAAGASSRMGRPKLLLPWGATSVLGHLIAQWQALGAGQVAVVCAAGDPAVGGELDRLAFPPQQRIINPAPARGMFGSIQCAARWPGWEGGLTHWALVLGDQPHLKLETLRALLAFGAAHPEHICQPGRGGRPRHPVLLPNRVFRQLSDAAETNLKQFLQARAPAVALCDLDDPGLDLDLDTPADYEKARRLCFPQPAQGTAAGDRDR